MATTIRVEKAHTLGLDEAKTRGHALLERFAQKLSHFISETHWNQDGTHGTASGKLFESRFDIRPDSVVVTVELKSLMVRAMKGQLESQIKTSLDKRFS